MRIDRMLAITVLLLNKRRVTARELAEKYEVSIRTIYRDIEAINLAGIPIISFPGNAGGFGIVDNYKLDKQLLTLKDMMAILSALKGVNLTLADNKLDSAIHKISNLVPDDKKKEVELYDEQMVIDVLPWGTSKKFKENMKIIHKSITSAVLLQIVYRNSKNEQVIRLVEPMTLFLKGYYWYFFGFCRLKNDFRIFKLSRIKEIIVKNEFFTRRSKSYKEYYNFDEITTGIDIVLKFSRDARTRVEDFFDETQILHTKDGYMLVKVQFPEDEWVYSLILSYGEYVEVIEPIHIRDIIKAKAKKILEKYKNNIES